MQDSPPIQSAKHLQTGLLLALAGTSLFALKSIFIKLAYEQGVDTTTLLTLRMLISMPFYGAMLWWLLRKPSVRVPEGRQWLAVAGLGFIGYYLSSYLDMLGLNYISAQLERLMLYTYPIMTSFLGWLFFREKITKRVALALLLTYSGVLLLYLHEASMDTTDTTLGILLVAGAALSFSCYVLLSKRYIGELGSRLFTSIAMLASTIYVLLHFSLTHEFKDLLINQAAWGYALMLAVFSTILPSFMVSEAIGRIGAARTSIVGTAGPVFTIVLAVVLLGEPFGLFHLAGMVLVMTGVALLRK